MLVSLSLRDVVCPGNHTNPDRKDPENTPFLPKLQAIMQAALDTAHSLCPAVVQKSGLRDQLVNAMSERIYLQDHLNLSTVLDQMVTDVFSKLKWVTCCSSGAQGMSWVLLWVPPARLSLWGPAPRLAGAVGAGPHTPLSPLPVKSSCLSQLPWPTASWTPCWET